MTKKALVWGKSDAIKQHIQFAEEESDSTKTERGFLLCRMMIVAVAVVSALKTSAVVCDRCTTRSNPNARYCFNCGKMLPAPTTLEEKYEALVREAMPTVLAAKKIAEEDVGLKTEESIRAVMAKFSKMSQSRKEQELEMAKKAVSQMPDAAQLAESSAMMKKAHNLYVAIIKANTEREAMGFAHVWPQSAESLEKDESDISGRLFRTSSDYFRELLNMGNVGKKEWAPYIIVDSSIVFPKGESQARWIVAKGLTSEMADSIPVIVSANVDPASLVSVPGKYKGSQLKGALRFSGGWAIIVLKGGKPCIITRKNAALSEVYGQQDFTLPKGFGYLAP